MRVLFHNSNRGAAFGGVEHWMLNVAGGLIGRGHYALLYGRPGAGWLQEAARREIPRVEGFFGMELNPRAIAHLRATLRTHEIDVVFAKSKKGARTAAAAMRLAGGGSVILVLGAEGQLSNRAMDRWTWRYAVDRAIVRTEEAKRRYERFPWVASEKLCVLPKGVDLSLLDPNRVDGATTRASLGIPPDALVVGTVGRLSREKGHTFLLRAAARLHPELPEARYLVVGGGSEEARLRSQARRLGLDDRVIFTGYRHDIPALIAAMDIFALPSRTENAPAALLEAMAMARPVVSTATIGVREVLEDGVSGFVVPIADPDALAQRVLLLARDASLRQAMGMCARARIHNGLTHSDMLTRVERLLEDVRSARLRGARATCGFLRSR